MFSLFREHAVAAFPQVRSFSQAVGPGAGGTILTATTSARGKYKATLDEYSGRCRENKRSGLTYPHDQISRDRIRLTYTFRYPSEFAISKNEERRSTDSMRTPIAILLRAAYTFKGHNEATDDVCVEKEKKRKRKEKKG